MKDHEAVCGARRDPRREAGGSQRQRRRRSLRLKVDMIACDGRGLCAEALPELIRLDDWGFPMITGDVRIELADEAAEAVRLCPRLALRLEK